MGNTAGNIGTVTSQRQSATSMTSKSKSTHPARRPKLLKKPNYSKSKSSSKDISLRDDTPIPGSPCIPDEDYNPRENHWRHWDLIPKDKKKEFPYWFEYTKEGKQHKDLNLLDFFSRVPRQNLHKLLDIVTIVHGGDPPSPRELVVVRLLMEKVEKWEEAEKSLHGRRNGFYCEDPHISKKAWYSWMMTQNRDFGSAVWRWLRLTDWDAHQTPQMKGLWHQAVYGDWNKYKTIMKARENSDVLTEWQWNQGLDKETAQKDFIAAAEKMGIPPVHWERPSHRNPSWLTGFAWGSTKPETLRISTREPPKLTSHTLTTLSDGTTGNTLGSIAGGGSASIDTGAVLDSVTKLLGLMGSSTPREEIGDSKEHRKRLHARDWKVVVTL